MYHQQMEIPIKLPSHCQYLLFIPHTNHGPVMRVIGRDCYVDFNITTAKLGNIYYISPGFVSFQYITKQQCSIFVDDNKLNKIYNHGGILINKKYSKSIQLFNIDFNYSTVVYNFSECFDRIFYVGNKFYATQHNIPYLHTFDVMTKEYFNIRFECGFITYMDEKYILTNRGRTIYCYNSTDLCMMWNKEYNNPCMSSCCYNNDILYVKDEVNIYKINVVNEQCEKLNIDVRFCYNVYVGPDFIFMVNDQKEVIKFIRSKS